MTESRRAHLTGVIYVMAAITAWGVYFPFAKLILLKLSPIVFLVFRLGIGTSVLALMCLRRRRSLRIPARDAGIVVVAGLIGIVLHQLVQVTGLQFTTATHTGWILTVIPPVTGVLGWLFLHERITLGQVAGLGVAMIGVVFFVSDGRPTTLSFAANRGDLLALASVGTWSVYTVLTKSRLTRVAALPVITLQMAVGFGAFLLIGGRAIPSEVARLNGGEWLIVGLIGVIPSGLAYLWWTSGLQRLSAVNTATFLFIEAVIASLTGFLLLGEQFTVTMVVASGIIIAGVSITQRRRP
jgi:drug/metabolite transporter (DMT)-like permease